MSLTEVPFEAYAERDMFKVYMCDPGLFLSMLRAVSPADVLEGNMGIFKGAVFENLIAGILHKQGRPLFYFHKDSGLELDFLISHRMECVPVEVKAVNGNAKSLRTVLNHPEKYHVTQAFKLGDYNVGRTGPVLAIPHYMSFLFDRVIGQ